MNKIAWDNTIKLSGKKYLSSEISTIIKEQYKNEEFKELELTAKEWISYEINKCKRELEKNRKEINSKKDLENDLKELMLLEKYFNNHITKWDILGLHSMDNEDYNKSLDNNYNNIKNLINEKVKKKKQQIDDIQKLQTDIKRICLENIKLILEKDYNSEREQKETFKKDKQELTNRNKEISDKRRLKERLSLDEINEELLNTEKIRNLNQKIKTKIPLNYFELADTLLRKNNITLGKNHKQTILHTDTYTQNNVELYVKKLKK